MSSERPSLPATYEPGRNPDGTFAAGNKLAKGRGFEVNRKMHELREMWYQCQQPDDMVMVYTELLKIVRECPVWDVKLKAAMYMVDRSIGKPTERVEMDVSGTGQGGPLVNVNLSAEELAIASRIVGKLGGGEPPDQLPASEF